MYSTALKRKAPVLYAEDKTRKNPFKILVFTMLSARTKDATTIKVVNHLFAMAATPKAIRALGQKQLEKILYGVGFYRTKTKHLLEMCKILQDGTIPNTLEKLLELQGVGRKTANIVLARAFNQKTLGVDVHVHRISNRLGLVKTKKPEETEIALLKILPSKHIRKFNRNFVAFGQTVCLPRNPDCSHCPLEKLCPKQGVVRKIINK
ncbi:G/T mismatches repair enzyme [Candidatus Bilamarchaeum dharawalense]|uniref:thymine-DNA glycosylase n=1 Tax=Candidatus Bilamarchaeum dharawalense TaxID=2885759 RepID=A0A5E4LQ68_9ARCH|nr:G/T mismatches repair enzyme [Candidatus Bilamarchaeum dharawalense]